MQVLEQIVSAKREAVAARKQSSPLAGFVATLEPARRSLRQAIRQRGCGFVLECKKAAPSAGLLREHYDPAELARQYEKVASGISVLTDEPFFQGHLSHLRAVSEAVALPVLCKDFVVDPYQIYEARAHGAHAILLMLSVLEPAELRACLAVTRELEMDALVEVHDEGELEQALEAEAELIGINNRNLKTLNVALETTEALAARVPPETVLISESGIRFRDDVRRLRGSVDGFLIGSSLMRRADLSHAARELAYGRVKVCGLTRAEDAKAAWEAGAVFGGMIFADRSPRRIDLEHASKLRQAAPLRWVGLFVDAADDQVVRAVEALGLSAVQLHGDESPEQLSRLRERLPAGCELWKALRVRGQDVLPQAKELGADRLLLDAYDPQRHGGTGQRFDWTVAARHPERDSLVLAGGLAPSNAIDADALGAWALDVNSGVESAPGIKDAGQIEAFFSAVRVGAQPRSGGRRQ
jgi:indole-3-glycerol phosphate synthase/phosphoribosylanthranilate isomerase